MRIIILSIVLITVGIDFCRSLKCTQKTCKGENCTEKSTECFHGECSAEGSCLCFPCFKGEKCTEYNDEHHPVFLKKEETIFVEPYYKGLIYNAKARDEDRYKTCDPGKPCPCGDNSYGIVSGSSGSDLFQINQATGDLTLKENSKMIVGSSYKIEISISNYKEESQYELETVSFDVFILHINIRESTLNEKMLLDSETLDIEKEKSKYNKDVNTEAMERVKNQELSDANSDAIPFTRKKREAFGTARADTNLTLEVTNSGFQDPLLPGNTIDLKLTIILPNVPTSGTSMDLLVEIFVMDAVSGITTFVLCDVQVVTIGSTIMDNTGTSNVDASSINANFITMKLNPGFPNIYDRAVLNFGQIYNTDTYSGAGSGYGDSTIEITFSATLLSNDLFTNDTAIITAGAEFDNENNVWVSQAISNYNGDPAVTYQSDITLMGPDTLPQYSSGTFDIVAYLSDPYETVLVEVFTPPDGNHDEFSIENFVITSRGANYVCAIPNDVYVTYPSVTGKSNHKTSLTFPIVMSNINHDDLAGETSDVGNQILLSFNIFMLGGSSTGISKIGAGISVGTVKIWTALINVTVTTGVIPAVPGESVFSVTAVPVDTSTSSPQVNQYMTATWDVQVALVTPNDPDVTTNAEFECTATPGIGNKICGVMYGRSGKYIGAFPNLIDIVVYDDAAGTAVWKALMNTSAVSTDQERKPNQDYISFEVTVMYLTDTIADATVVCTGGTVTLSADVSPAVGSEDMTGVSVLLGSDTNFYDVSTIGIMATLTFPEAGFGYSSMVLETSGDFQTTSWGAEVCSIQVLKIGRNVGCISRTASPEAIKEKTTVQKSIAQSVYDDAASLDFGEVCGSKRDDANTLIDDNDVQIRVFYSIPAGQIVADGKYNLSLGVLLDDNLIWVGWADYDVLASVPAIDSAEAPVTVFSTPILSEEQYMPIITRVFIKMHPGTIRPITLTATSSDSSIIGICKIIILNIGRNFACIDQNPYGKEKVVGQTVILTHDILDWRKTATLDLGLIRNFGTGNIDASLIADEDTIEVIVVSYGSETGSGTLTLVYNDGGSDVTKNYDLTITTNLQKTSNSLTMNVTGLDDTFEYYKDVMKQVQVELIVPRTPDYDRPVKMIIINTNPTELTICYGALTFVGANIPCLIPSFVPSVPTTISGNPAIEIQMAAICYYHLTENATESTILIRVGVMVKADISATSFKIELHEDTTITPTTVSLTAGGTYVPENFTTADVKLHMVQNESVTLVIPGKTFWLGLYIEIPPETTIPIELGIMTSAADGHAFATVHGFRWGETQGKNIQCPEPIEMYVVSILQNSTTDGIPMIHESQTDTLTVNLKYITNTGLSYFHMNTQPGDDLAVVEAELLIADHESLVDLGTFNVSFAIKVGTTIIVIEKTLTLDRTGPFEMILLKELSFTDVNFDSSVPVLDGDKLGLTVRLQHVRNESQIEAYDALIRIMLPNYVTFANESNNNLVSGVTNDSFVSNITGVLTATDYLEFNIDYLFFTDILEWNFTVTVDPYGSMTKGLEILPSSALLRLVCKSGSSLSPVKYCGDSSYVNYLVRGTECWQNLLIDSYENCQFLASTAIDLNSDAHHSATAAGWSPAVRDISVWDHYISIDFKSIARVTKIVFASVTDASASAVGLYKLKYSNDGVTFIDTCPQELNASNIILPSECRFAARYGRIVLVSALDADLTKRIGVSFTWYGCYQENNAAAECTFPALATPLTTNMSNWRHAAMDTVNNIIYFCDWNPLKNRLVCFSSPDGDTWQVLPSYIGSLKGFDDDTTHMMYANDVKMRAVVASADGIKWSLVDSAILQTLTVVPPTAIPGMESSGFPNANFGSWTGEFDGLKLNGVTKVKWEDCCS